jgi:hypothetical protein
MIQQLGPLAFFVSFSSGENHWKPLTNALKHMKENNKPTIENDIEEIEVETLIRNDRVTCVRYYKNKINYLRQLISHDYKYYGELKVHFFVTKFQKRGSQHDHALLWIKDAPIYGRNTNVEIKYCVDRYLSCDSRILGNDFKTIQHHHHTRTCRKNKNTHCRFNFSIPPMRKTIILELTEFNDDTTKKNAKLMFDTLEHEKYNETYAFDNFLESLSLTEEDYINVIKCILNQTKILLERRLIDIWTNNFSCHIPKISIANIDSQYVLHSYATTTYCISYMTKLYKTMTMEFKHI